MGLSPWVHPTMNAIDWCYKIWLPKMMDAINFGFKTTDVGDIVGNFLRC